MKRLVLAASLLILPLGAYAAAPDATFYKHAAEGGIAEVELGNLALKKSATPGVQEYASMMVKDHQAANEKLQSIADSKSIKLPTSASVAQMATKAKLDVLTGETFDKSYIKAMIKDHETTIAAFRHEAAVGQDPDAKAFAKATLPTLKEHLKKIQALASASGVTAG
jgi:putative membrane protein